MSNCSVSPYLAAELLWQNAEVRMRNAVVATVGLVVVLTIGIAAAGEINPAFFGTWKLNTEKSKADSGETPKSQTVTLAPRGDGFVLTIEVDNGDGTVTRTTRTAALDGKEVVVQNSATREAYTSIDARTIQRVVKLNGQVRNTLKLTVARDGKTVTTEVTGTGPDGKPFRATSVLDKL
jgi:hypothetical protein